MLRKWNYLESSRIFYWNKDYINQFKSSMNATANEEAWILVNLSVSDRGFSLRRYRIYVKRNLYLDIFLCGIDTYK